MIANFRRFVKKGRTNLREGHWSPKGRVLKRRLIACPALWIVLAAATGLALGSIPTPPPALSSVPPLNVDIQDRITPEFEPPSPLTPKHKRDLLKSNFEKVKRDTDDLVELAKSLQDDLGKSNENVLSLKVVEKAEKIEKLARKIKTTAKGQ